MLEGWRDQIEEQVELLLPILGVLGLEDVLSNGLRGLCVEVDVGHDLVCCVDFELVGAFGFVHVCDVHRHLAEQVDTEHE